MYKTIRHGENSLQYTILPQNDDFRMEGKLTSSSSNGTHKPKRGRRRSFFAYLGLLFVCTVIIGAILIPFLVSAECLPNPSDWFIRTKMSEHGSSLSNNKSESTIKAYLMNNQKIPSNDILSTVKSDETNTSENIFTIPILNDKKPPSSLEVALTDTRMLPSQPTIVTDNGIRTSVEVPKITTKVNQMTTNEDVQSTTSDPVPSILSTTTTKTTSTKKPIVLPVLAKTNSVVRENGKLVDVRAEPKNWIRSHWPFIDPSTYFQWAGYKSEDSVLLPAILGVALIGMILIITLCLVARNKKTIVSSVRKRNRNDVEEADEDNTTLLTTGNLSDED